MPATENQRARMRVSLRGVGIGTCLFVLTTTAFARAGDKLTGSVQVNGSSTVAPIMLAGTELYRAKEPVVRVTVGVSGTGGGFKKFLEEQPQLRTDINNASRPIRESELAKAQSLGVQFIELPVALDGLSVVVHPQNDFCDSLTVEELKRIWSPDSKIQNWRDVRPSFPDLKLKLYGAGTDSGTFDYFTEVICGKEKASRSDFTASENDNVLVQGIAGDKGSLGYLGFSYYEANKTKLKVLGVDRGDGKPVVPSVGTIRSGEYYPLSRPLFLYVNAESWKRPEVRSFLDFVFADPKSIVEHKKVNYVALSDAVYAGTRARLAAGKTGSVLSAAAAHGPVDLEKLFQSP